MRFRVSAYDSAKTFGVVSDPRHAVVTCVDGTLIEDQPRALPDIFPRTGQEVPFAIRLKMYIDFHERIVAFPDANPRQSH